MTALYALWLPILLSAVIVFVVSSLIHTVLPWHKNDYRKIPNEDKVMGGVASVGDPAGRLHDPAPVEHAGSTLTGVCREDEQRPGVDDDRLAQRPHVDGEQSGVMVPLFGCRRAFRCLCRRSRAAGRSTLCSRFPVGWSDCIHRILGRALANVDLVSAVLEHDHQGDHRWIGLRAPDGSDLRLDVAALAAPCAVTSFQGLAALSAAAGSIRFVEDQHRSVNLCAASALRD